MHGCHFRVARMLWERAAVQWAVVLDTLKDVAYSFTGFQRIFKEGWLTGKIGSPQSILGSAVTTFVGGQKLNDPTSPAYSPTPFDCVSHQRREKLRKTFEGFLGPKENKRWRVETLEKDKTITDERELNKSERERLGSEQIHETGEALIHLGMAQSEIQFFQASTLTETTKT